MKLKIKITQEVLEATKMCGIDRFILKGSISFSYSQNCAITNACRELFPNCFTLDKIYMINKYDYRITIANLPVCATNFIDQFDKATSEERVKMKPFEFEIELTEEALDLISIDQITKVLETSTTLKVV